MGTSLSNSLEVLDTNTTYDIVFVYDETGFYEKHKKVTETTWTTRTPVAITSNNTINISSGWIGNQNSGTSSYYTGSIDLNNIEVYADGDLVYQPCLLIPYSESKTGSKVVDVYARPRVQSMYEQFGYAPYYTIDEANQNFTLYMGSIYGMKVDKTSPHIIESYVNGTSSYELYSPNLAGKKLLVQRGLVTMSDNSGSQVVNLLKNYDDTNYWVIANQTYLTTTIPNVTGVDMIATESMTTSSFRVVGSTDADTPSAQGTLVFWEAKGYIS